MFTEFYALTGRPFQLNPDPRFFYGSRNHKKAMAYLTYGLAQGEGFVVITGDIGAGKTTLVGHLLSQLDSQKYVAAKLVTTQLEADDTLRMVATAFGLGQQGADKATLLGKIEQFLIANQQKGRRVLLLIDEAQNLPARSLEELRMLSNFQVNDKALLQSFLLGQPNFRETLASSDLEQLRQRVIASYHLGPMDAEETRAYIEHRLRTVGWRNDPSFGDEAFRLIFQHTQGVPRKINSLCTRLLLFGVLEEKHEFDAAAVEEVVRDLVQENGQSAPRPEPKRPGPPPMPMMDELPTPSRNPWMEEARELSSRVTALEQHVKMHDRTIRRALDMAAYYFDSARPKDE